MSVHVAALNTDSGKDSEQRSMEDRACLACMPGSVEDEHHCLLFQHQ